MGLVPSKTAGRHWLVSAADEAVELLETQACRPEIERPGLAVLPIGHVVVLAEPGGVPALLPEDLGNRRGVLAHQAVVAGVAGRQLHDVRGMHRVVIAPGEQRGPRGRRDRRRVELRVAQPVLGEPVKRRRADRPAEGARCTVTDIVEDDQDDVGRPLGRLQRLGEIGFRVLHTQPDLPLEGRRR